MSHIIHYTTGDSYAIIIGGRFKIKGEGKVETNPAKIFKSECFYFDINNLKFKIFGHTSEHISWTGTLKTSKALYIFSTENETKIEKHSMKIGTNF